MSELFPPFALRPLPVGEANALLLKWGHYLGRCDRPCGMSAWGIELDNDWISIAVAAAIVSPNVAGYDRQEVVELARLCSRPDTRWATRVMLRLWREIAAPRWPYWPVQAAVAYSANVRHDGRIYRFDGWEQITTRASSPGGGTWSTRRDAGHPARDAKTLWLWRYRDTQPAASPPHPGPVPVPEQEDR